MPSFRPIGFLVAVALIAVTTTGCEEEVVSAIPTDRAFSLYGALMPEADTQWVRVYPIEGRLVPTEREPLAARLTTTDVETGEVRVWRDSLFQEFDGSWSHIFWSPFAAEYGHRYRLEITATEDASGERVSRVEVPVPVRGELLVPDPEAFPRYRNPVLVEGDVPRLMNVVLDYRVKFADGPPEETVRHVPISYEAAPRRVDEGWVIPVNFERDRETIVEYLRQTLLSGHPLWQPTHGVRLLGLELRLEVVTADWVPPEGGFDPDVLVQPGVLNNVENGFGFVGAGYDLELRWMPPREVLDEAGFRPPVE